MINKTITTLIFAGFAFGCLYAHRSSGKSRDHRADAVHPQRLERSDRAPSPSRGPAQVATHAPVHFEGGGHLILDVGGFAQVFASGVGGAPGVSFEWVQKFGFPGDPQAEALASTYGGAVPASGEYRLTQTFRTSFLPRHFCARDSREVYIAGHPYRSGVADISRLVIERWTFEYPDEYPYVHRDTQAAGIGIPTPYSYPNFGVYGGPPRHIEAGDKISESRELIYLGSSLANITGMVADPDGRFLIMTTSSAELVQLNFSDPMNPTVIADVNDAPSLQAAFNPWLMQHATLGRMLVVPRGPLPPGTPDPAGNEGNHSRSVFIDGENDGIFESVVNVGDGQWHSNGVTSTIDAADESLYEDGFVTDLPCDQ